MAWKAYGGKRLSQPGDHVDRHLPDRFWRRRRKIEQVHAAGGALSNNSLGEFDS
jgi:hypothetical protein